jgi:dethiobiotin synthetase
VTQTVVVTGTGTDIGKTWFTAATIEALRAGGHAVIACKPVQSFAPGDEGRTDADVLARASRDDPLRVCPSHRWLAVAVAPPMAARRLGLPPFTIANLADEVKARLTDAPDDTFVFVEGAGGVRSPLADDGDTAALAHALAADRIVIVADAGLGTINAVRLTVAALTSWTPVVALNRYDRDDALHRENCTWLRERDGYCVVTSPTDLATELAGDLTGRGARPSRS